MLRLSRKAPTVPVVAESTSHVLTAAGLLTETQTAEILGVSVRRLRALRYRGDGPAYVKTARRVRYAREDVLAYLATRRITPQAVTSRV